MSSWAKIAQVGGRSDPPATTTAAPVHSAPAAVAAQAAVPAAPVQAVAPAAPQPVAAAAPVEAPVAAAAAAVDAAPVVKPAAPFGGPKNPNALYFGNLHPDLKPKMLAEYIAFALEVKDFPAEQIRMVHDYFTRKSAGYAYVNFGTAEEATTVETKMNFMPIMERPVRIMRSQRDPALRKSGKGNLYVRGLQKDIDGKQLHATFSVFGPILCAKLRTDKNGESTGSAFVQYADETDAKKAIEGANGKYLQGSQVTIVPYIPLEQRTQAHPDSNYTNVYVKDFDTSVTLEQFTEFFAKFGKIHSPKIMMSTDAEPVSKGFGFVAFADHESAKAAVEAAHGKVFPGFTVGTKPLYCQRAQSAVERERLREANYKQRVQEREKHLNLFVKPLAETCTDEDLRAAFEEFGDIASTRVRSDTLGRKHGFVSFRDPNEGQRALHHMNGLVGVNPVVKKISVPSQPLFVAVAQKKADRDRLFGPAISLMNMNMPMPWMFGHPGHPGYMPRFGRPEAMIHPAAPYGGQRTAPRTAYQHARPGPYQRQPQRPAQTPDVNEEAVRVAGMPPDARRQYLGDKLYPKVVEELRKPDLGRDESSAPRITGMLLELEDAFSLLENPSEFVERVKEAISILDTEEPAQ